MVRMWKTVQGKDWHKVMARSNMSTRSWNSTSESLSMSARVIGTTFSTSQVPTQQPCTLGYTTDPSMLDTGQHPWMGFKPWKAKSWAETVNKQRPNGKIPGRNDLQLFQVPKALRWSPKLCHAMCLVKDHAVSPDPDQIKNLYFVVIMY